MKNVQLISHGLRRINYLYNKMLSKELSAFKMDHHFEVLMVLATQESPVTQNKLAELLQIDKSITEIIVFDLEKRRLLQIKINPNDRMQYYVSLSPSALNSIPH